MEKFTFRERRNSDAEWVKAVVIEQWGSPQIVSKDHMYEAVSLPGFIAEENDKPVGLILYAIEAKECEIVALYSSIEKSGIGTKLMDLVKEIAQEESCERIWLQTTNDNTLALRFYQKRGYTIAAIRINAIEAQRKIKSIPQTGHDGIPIRDEIELEIKF